MVKVKLDTGIVKLSPVARVFEVTEASEYWLPAVIASYNPTWLTVAAPDELAVNVIIAVLAMLDAAAADVKYVAGAIAILFALPVIAVI